MKLIIAYIQPNKIEDVKRELYAANVFKMSVVNALGAGQQKGYTENYRGNITEVHLRMKVRIEIAINEDYVKPTLDAIVKGAKTGNIGDGKIFVITLDECIRIRTEESGTEAIG